MFAKLRHVSHALMQTCLHLGCPSLLHQVSTQISSLDGSPFISNVRILDNRVFPLHFLGQAQVDYFGLLPPVQLRKITRQLKVERLAVKDALEFTNR
ncbi:hypothetical protein, partial [Duganella qianjiadongensis]